MPDNRPLQERPQCPKCLIGQCDAAEEFDWPISDWPELEDPGFVDPWDSRCYARSRRLERRIRQYLADEIICPAQSFRILDGVSDAGAEYWWFGSERMAAPAWGSLIAHGGAFLGAAASQGDWFTDIDPADMATMRDTMARIINRANLMKPPDLDDHSLAMWKRERMRRFILALARLWESIGKRARVSNNDCHPHWLHPFHIFFRECLSDIDPAAVVPSTKTIQRILKAGGYGQKRPAANDEFGHKGVVN